MTKQLNIVVPDDLYKTIRQQAVDTGTTITKVAIGLLSKPSVVLSVSPESNSHYIKGRQHGRQSERDENTVTPDEFKLLATDPDAIPPRVTLAKIVTLLSTRPVFIANPVLPETTEEEPAHDQQ